ncbi:MAG: pentapeptide repeat-containing protein [Candidatus Electrothrix aestuarii]|uniref:Pentapeptide repeat-containing protein n=1 Tax=Candidatus Electrothrix aestuarii TaxID=3062594 RepID=A0AAU8LZ32_9BACT|nr:pentapeptide repeat-containing protein [Candidatus Electrothrix aestuarii]
MANKEQLEILKQGVETWNAWREEHPDAKINLRGAKLDGLDLSGANFREADIRGASFKNAILVRTDFTRALAGHAILGKWLQFILWIVYGIACGNFMFLATNIYLSVLLRNVDQSFSNTIIVLFYIFTIIIYFIIGIWKYKISSVVCWFAVIGVGTWMLSPLQDIGKSISVFFLTLPVIGFMSLAWAVMGLASIVGYKRNTGTLIFLLSGVAGVISLAGQDHMGIRALPLALALIFNIILIGRGIGLAVRHEEPQFAFLRRPGLFMLSLCGTSFWTADLKDAIFYKASLRNVRFGNAILTGTSWQGAQGLRFARCNGTILNDRDVRELLVRRRGQGLILKGKNLQGAYLVGADLCSVDLRETDLMQANLSGADITAAKLYGSARENWVIDDICCKYVYWDEAGKERTPPDRDFRPGEFEELYKQLPTFEYFFEQGFTPLDPLVMDRVVHAINQQYKEFQLELVNFDKRGQPHATFTVCQLDYIDTAKEQVSAVYEANKVQPENQDQLMAAFMGLIENQNKSLDIIKQLGGSKMGDTYNISGGQVGAVGKSAISTGNTFQQIVNDLSRLHQEMRRSSTTPEQQAAAQDVAKAEQAARQEDELTMKQHLKNAGQWALDCAQKIGTDVVTEYLKKITTGM